MYTHMYMLTEGVGVEDVDNKYLEDPIINTKYNTD